MVSLIITTYNEGRNIGGLLGDVLEQTRPPNEVVLVDGGSQDDTMAVCEALRPRLTTAGISLNLRVETGVNIAKGRNIAIDSAAHECLCVTDAGCRLDPRWSECITRPILDGRADLVGGFYRPVHHNRFQRILAAITVADEPPFGFLPSSRSVAFTRAIWRQAGHYPEWLPWGEDTLFDERCLAAGARYIIAANALVHWEVRRTYCAAMKQFYRYAWGDGRRRRLSLSHTVNTGSFILSLALGVAHSPWWLLAFLSYTMLITLRATPRLAAADQPIAMGVMLGLRLARAAGFLRGLIASIGGAAKEAP